MHTFKRTAAQGDVLFVRLSDDYAIPSKAERVASDGGNIVVAHSETGHNHVFADDGVALYRLPDSIMECLLVVDKPSVLKHLRTFDTHEPILFDKGVYRVRRQREYTPEGFRRVED